MDTLPYPLETLLTPIAGPDPCGVDLRSSVDWARIQDAMRGDETDHLGAWRLAKPKRANWPLAREIAAYALADKSKDVQLAVWFLEASVRLEGFAGLKSGLRVIRGLLDSGYSDRLHPRIEDDSTGEPIGPVKWLNEKLAVLIRQIPLTESYSGTGLSYLEYSEAKRIGTLEGCRTRYGAIDEEKKMAYEAAIADGRITEEQFESALRATSRSRLQELHSDAVSALDELDALSLNPAIPPVTVSRQALHDCLTLLKSALDELPPESIPPAWERDQSPAPEFEKPALKLERAPGDSWARAEYYIRNGLLQQGLAEMRRLAEAEPTGRDRFQRKLMIAEHYLAHKPIAAAILEDLAEQIDHFHLENWESPDLIGRVWSSLYACYRNAEEGTPEAARAAEILKRMCRLSPEHALQWVRY